MQPASAYPGTMCVDAEAGAGATATQAMVTWASSDVLL